MFECIPARKALREALPQKKRVNVREEPTPSRDRDCVSRTNSTRTAARMPVPRRSQSRVDEIGDRETHPLMGLLDIVSFFVRDYEERNMEVCRLRDLNWWAESRFLLIVTGNCTVPVMLSLCQHDHSDHYP